MSLGIKLNNPGNIIVSKDKWLGKIGEKKVGSHTFVVFSEMKYGLRAFFINLFNGYFFKNINTIKNIIEVYAPKSAGNNTDFYIENVSNWTGFDRHKELCFLEKFEILNLARAIFRQEGTSSAIPDKDLEKGYDMAVSYLINHRNWKGYKCYGVELGNTIEPVEITGTPKPKEETEDKKAFDLLEYLKKYWYLALLPILVIFLLIRKK